MQRFVPEPVFERMVAVRRDLHRHPELSWQEERTAERVCARLRELGVPHRRVTATGIVADLPGRGEGPRVALRADMDALPIQEETGLPFASVHDGVMHACGHDGHMSMLLGAAELLRRQGELPAAVRLIFQPAEETGNGARAMVEAGALDDVAMIFGGHLDRAYPPGTVVVADGVVNASTDTFRIRIAGQGAHAARPHEGVDAVVVGSFVVTALQAIVAREVDPVQPAVVTVGRFHAGSASNIMAGDAELEGTIRANDPDVRDHLLRAVRRVSESVAGLHYATAHVEFRDPTPAVRNAPPMAALARRAAARVVSERDVTALRHANMGAEDFSWYLERVPGCYVRYGARLRGPESPPAHSSRFDFDEGALAVGAAWLCAVALEAGRRAKLTVPEPPSGR